MTTLQPSLNKSFFFLIIISFSQFAKASEYCPKTFDVLEREKRDNYSFVPRNLEKLFCKNTFEGEHFKIVHATSNEAISFDHEDKALVQKAANVYWHLSVARNFWLNEIKSDYVGTLPQISIRLDITNAFSSTRQFKNEEQEKNYNNAWSVPAGQTPVFVKDAKKWGKEIWFSPMKKIESRKEMKSEGNNPIHESLELIKEPIITSNKNALLYQGLVLLVAPAINPNQVLVEALKRVGTIAVMWGLVETSKHIDKWFVEKYYYIDTAMVPEIIYHEFAHIALSDTMKTVHSVPVIEGMADYFAARVATRTKMYEGLDGFSNNKSKNAKENSFYHPYLEGSWNATSDFTLSLLWLGKTEFDKQNKKRIKMGQPTISNYDELVHKAHYDLNENSDIANGLTSALVKACASICQGKRAGVNTLNAVFEQKGLN
jgi:hypothetical protein